MNAGNDMTTSERIIDPERTGGTGNAAPKSAAGKVAAKTMEPNA